jgi:hypothetical protein
MADDIRRAEYEDVRMYARLVVGMQSQCVASGYVHPLTRKSLQDIVKTKEANDQELETMHLQHEEVDCGWDVDFIEDQEQNESQAPSFQHHLGARLTSVSPASNIVKNRSNTSIVSNTEHEDDGDDGEEGVFNMEL